MDGHTGGMGEQTNVPCMCLDEATDWTDQQIGLDINGAMMFHDILI